MYKPDAAYITNVDIHPISDTTFYPKTSANEVLLSPVVSITSHGTAFSLLDNPVIVELIKTAELCHDTNVKIVPIFSDTDQSVPPCWQDLDGECVVLEDRVRFKTTHFTFFAVIARFSPPSTTKVIDPVVPNTVELTVPELPGFTVEIPPKSIQSATEVKATLLYDDSILCKDGSNQPLASACVLLEPHGQQFSEKVSVNLPIPGYSEITAANPDANLQLLYSPNGSPNDWEIQREREMEIRKVGDHYVATFSIDHFSWWKIVWPEGASGVTKAIGTIFNHVKFLRSRCQVFMTNPRDVSAVSIQVLVSPFQDTPIEIPHNYHYMLHDSGSSPVQLAAGKLNFSLKLSDYLLPLKSEDQELQFEKCHQLSHDSAARAKFLIDLRKGRRMQLKDGDVIADLDIVDCENFTHECHLIQVILCLQK